MPKTFTWKNLALLIGAFVILVGLSLIESQLSRKSAPGPTKSLREANDRPRAFYFKETKVEEIQSLNQPGRALGDQLVISPGIYTIDDQSYDMQKEGLYRLLSPTKSNQQRIVYQNDIPSLLSGISWIASHGILDRDKSEEELLKKALTDKLSINCGALALFVLKGLNIQSRIVTTLTLEEWTSYDTGHTMVEVREGERWKLYDLDNNVIFRPKSGGQYLNFLEFVEAVPTDTYQMEKIADDAEYSVEGSFKEDYDYSFYFEAILSNEETLKNWYQKVIQVPLIGEYPTYYFFDDKNRARIESYAANYKYLPKDEFMKRFYP